MKRTKIFISKPVVFDKSILEISKIVIDEYDQTNQGDRKKQNYVKQIERV